MNISLQTQLRDSLNNKRYLEQLNLEEYETVDLLSFQSEDNQRNFLLYTFDNNYSVIQSDGLLDFKYLGVQLTKKDNCKEKIEEIITEAKDSSKEYSLIFQSLQKYKESPASIISALNKLDCIPQHIGYFNWNLEEHKIPFALITESLSGYETFENWVKKQLKDLSQKNDSEAIKLATDTLEQLFEALGVSLGELHNQIFKLSAFNDSESFFNSTSYTNESYQHIKNKIQSFKNKDKDKDKNKDRFPLENIIENLSISLEDTVSLGVEIRCHGNFDLSKIFRTTKGLKIADFSQTTSHLIDWNRDTDTPINDVADLLISIKVLKESTEGRMIANIDEIISSFENSFFNAYLSSVQFPFPEPYEKLLKAKLIERAFIKSFNCFVLDDSKNEELFLSILKSLII